MNSVLSFWNSATDETIGVDCVDSLTDSQLRSLLDKLLVGSASLVSIVQYRGPQHVNRCPLIVMDPSFMDTSSTSTTASAIYSDVLDHLKKVTTSGDFPYVLFPMKTDDSQWCVAILGKDPNSQFADLVVINCSDLDQLTTDRTELIKQFTASLISLLRIAPTTSLRLHKLRFEDTFFMGKSPLLTALLIADLVGDFTEHSAHFFTDIINSTTQPTVEVVCTDYHKQLDTLVKSLGTGQFREISLSANSRIQFLQEVEELSNYTRNLEGDRLIFPEYVLKLVEQSGIGESFNKEFVDTTSILEYLSVQAGKDSRHVQMTDWLYALLTQFPKAVSVDTTEHHHKLVDYERVEFKKKDFIDFICTFSEADPSLVLNELKTVRASRRLDRKMAEAKFHYLRSKSNPSLLWRLRPTRREAQSSLSMIINPLDLLNYCYYAHVVLGEHGSVKKSYDAIKHIDNVTRNMVWFVCSHCKECNGTGKPSSVANGSGKFTQPFQKLCIELVEREEGEYKWVLVVCDEYSQFLWLFPLKDRLYSTIRETLMVFFASNTFVREEIQTSTLHTEVSRLVENDLNGKVRISSDASDSSFPSTIATLKQQLEQLNGKCGAEPWSLRLSLLSNHHNTTRRGGSLESTPVSLLFTHEPVSKIPFRKPRVVNATNYKVDTGCIDQMLRAGGSESLVDDSSHGEDTV